MCPVLLQDYRTHLVLSAVLSIGGADEVIELIAM
jgi:hypothetical protein